MVRQGEAEAAEEAVAGVVAVAVAVTLEAVVAGVEEPRAKEPEAK